ncbi:mitochondrial intermembrane space import and assembly protein 40-like [Oppia nitens]|uniref:mitochondrial intermembrane space import and assembly protein 40-like n=1 Tax=Oppia nitens TaxID=1686743 RepID=UPI0023DBC5E8|nr:mitochondrial intermembrane space import and assembly protein 40-like [Oppia nitens]
MSYCQEIGKDRIIFATKEDHSKPSTVELTDESADEPRGLILPNGDINWNCPCLGGMASGPCGYQFREAFGCFHYSTAENKGEDCVDKFTEMQDCMSQYPNLYSRDKDIADDNTLMNGSDGQPLDDNKSVEQKS